MYTRRETMQFFYMGMKFSFSYFSILPVKFEEKDDLSTKPVLASMLFFFPLVGLVLGLLTLGIYTLLEPLESFAALIAAVVYMMLYGFLHTEAIMDVADALYAKHSDKDTYEIMKEPTVGAMGVLWAISMLLLKVAGIIVLLMHEAYALFVSTLIVSRLGLLLLFLTQDFRSTFITTLQEAFKPKYFITSTILFTTIGLFMVGWNFLLMLSLGLILSCSIVHMLKKHIGFINGDVLGTTLESVEILLFVGIAALWL